MAKNIKVKLNMQGLNELMKSQEMQQHMLKAGQEVARTAGEGYEAEVHVADYVAISNVYAATDEAREDFFANNTLLKAAGSVGLSMSKKG